MASSLNANLNQPSLSCGTKLYSGLKLQFPSLYATGRPNLTAEFYGKVNKSLQCGTRNQKPTQLPGREPGNGLIYGMPYIESAFSSLDKI
ncbi:hypothetical protein OIU79_008546 [Salix purpurea]|uniref:Uncharacterized protein n=1 Tax=Salix purpurea TaxID=77065 RepID=A0A9Q0YWC9_SALPP|nr:hypothetical protein OIU79_008546 [Salix purpurea]